MERFTQLSQRTLNFSMVAAPSLMVVAMILLAPQQANLQSLDGSNTFLRSIASETNAWNNSHIAMLVSMLLFPLAFLGLYRQLIPVNFWMGVIGLFLAYIGVFLVGGQLALDFAYGALVTGDGDAETARVARGLIVGSSHIQIAFNAIANIGLILGWTIAALISLIYATPNRWFGVLVIGGWLTIILLNGKIPYIEAVGHAMMASAMVLSVLLQRGRIKGDREL